MKKDIGHGPQENVKGKGKWLKGSGFIYIAPTAIDTQVTQGAQVRITVLPANYTVPFLYLVSIHQMAHPQTEVADI